MLTSAAFCNPEAGLAALLSLGLPSETECDIQTMARGSNMHLKVVTQHTALLSALTLIMRNYPDIKLRAFPMEAILMLMPAKMAQQQPMVKLCGLHRIKTLIDWWSSHCLIVTITNLFPGFRAGRGRLDLRLDTVSASVLRIDT